MTRRYRLDPFHQRQPNRLLERLQRYESEQSWESLVVCSRVSIIDLYRIGSVVVFLVISACNKETISERSNSCAITRDTGANRSPTGIRLIWRKQIHGFIVRSHDRFATSFDNKDTVNRQISTLFYQVSPMETVCHSIGSLKIANLSIHCRADFDAAEAMFRAIWR